MGGRKKRRETYSPPKGAAPPPLSGTTNPAVGVLWHACALFLTGATRGARAYQVKHLRNLSGHEPTDPDPYPR